MRIKRGTRSPHLQELQIVPQELFDSASFEAKKMIVNAMIIRIDVFNGYELNIEFNFNIRQFFEGIANEEETETEAPVTLPKTA